jgi:hypothetical protein
MPECNFMALWRICHAERVGRVCSAPHYAWRCLPADVMRLRTQHGLTRMLSEVFKNVVGLLLRTSNNSVMQETLCIAVGLKYALHHSGYCTRSGEENARECQFKLRIMVSQKSLLYRARVTKNLLNTGLRSERCAIKWELWWRQGTHFGFTTTSNILQLSRPNNSSPIKTWEVCIWLQ